MTTRLIVRSSTRKGCDAGCCRTPMDTTRCARRRCARDFSSDLWQKRWKVKARSFFVRAAASGAIKDRRQPTRMLTFLLEGTAHRVESIRERKDFPRDEQVFIFGSHRMPVDALSRDSDFG